MRWFNSLAVCISLSLSSCNGLDRLVNGTHHSRDNHYDTTPVGSIPKRLEPYALFTGYAPDGSGLFLVVGGKENGLNIGENEANALKLTKYYTQEVY